MRQISKRLPHSRPRAFLLVAAVTAIVLGAVGGGTYAAFTATATNTGNQVASGTLALTDNDSGGAMFSSVTSLQPNSATTRCIKVTATGSTDSAVRLYGTVAGTGLAPYTSVKVTRGTYSGAEPAFGSCTNFAADATNYIGSGAGVIETGLLSDFPNTYGAGIEDPYPTTPEVWSQNESHVYKVDLVVGDNRSVEGKTATAAFTWEARAGTSAGATYAPTITGTSGLVGYWRLGESAGTAAADSSSSGNAGVFSGGYAFGTTGAIAGDTNKATTFNGSSGMVGVADSASLDTGDNFTYEAWVKRGTLGTTLPQGILTKSTGTPFVGFETDNKLYVYKYGTGGVVVSSSSAVADTNWHHIVVTKTGATRKVYIDGADVTVLGTNQTMANNTSPLSIGVGSTGGSGEWFNGTLDEVAVYNRALSAGEVLDHYQRGSTP